MKYYKGFNPDFTCQGKQYEENHDYEETGTQICRDGMMHFCENPFDVWKYYPIVNAKGELNEFAEVEPLAEVVKREDKSATTKLHIGAKIGLPGIIKAAVDFVIEKTKSEKEEDVIGSSGYYAQIGSSGDFAQIGSSGDFAQIGSSGDYAQIGSSGDFAKIGSSGDFAKIGSSGDYAQIGSSGFSAQIVSSGDYAQIGSSGDFAQIGSSGYFARIGSSGDFAKIVSTGEDSVICCAGHGCIVKAKKGSWITLAEWERNEEKGRWIPKTVKTFFVDGETVKADTAYTLEDGDLKEVEE